MGRIDITFNKCLNNNERYADCFNTAIGKKIINPGKLKSMDRITIKTGSCKNSSYEKKRDCIKSYGGDKIYAILVIESQPNIHHAMASRSYICNAYNYDEQLSALRKMHKIKKDLKNAEFIAVFSKNDRIIPTVTISVYFGREHKNKDELADMDEDLYNAISAITDTKELDRLIEANKNICNIAAGFAPDYDCNNIYNLLKSI